MKDLSFIRRGSSPYCDLAIVGGDLVTGDELETFILKAILTDGRVTEEEFKEAKIGNLNSNNVNRLRGWWGDSYQEIKGHKIGSKLWLNVRQKKTTKVLEDQIEYVKLALKPLIDDGVASSVAVTAEWGESDSGDGVMLMSIQITKPNMSTQNYKFAFVWEGK